MRIIFNCTVKTRYCPIYFFITGFWKKGNGIGTKTFEFNPWKKNLNDQDNQSYYKDIKNSFLKYCLSA